MGSSIRLLDLAIPADQPDTEFQRGTVADLLGRRQTTFPGAQPVSFARHHLRELCETDYFMCEKTDGMRCLLYLTQHIAAGGELVEAQYFIDRKNDYYYIPRDALHIPRSPEDLIAFHTGTLLDGELVRQRFRGKDGRVEKEQITYLIFDCLATDGESILDKDFSRRLARIDSRIIQPMKAFKRKYREDVDAQPFQIEMKKMEFPYGVQMMFKDVLPNLPHGNDGLIFTCKDTFYVPGTDEHVLKWKPPEENTIDFRLMLGEFPRDEEDGGMEDWEGKPEMGLWVNHGGRNKNQGVYQHWADLNVTDTEWEAMKGMHQQLDGRIIECFRDPHLASNNPDDERAGWRPKLEPNGTPRFRDDKTDANYIDTVEKVIESIKDAVSQEDLIERAFEIRRAFKERQAHAQAKERKAREVEAMERRRREEEKRRKEQQVMRREEEERVVSVGVSGEGGAGEDDGPGYEE